MAVASESKLDSPSPTEQLICLLTALLMLEQHSRLPTNDRF